MTTKVYIANDGPDQVLVRTVDYSEEKRLAGVAPIVVKDQFIVPKGWAEFYVHPDQQLIIGEKRS